MTQKMVSGMSSYGPPRNYRGALEVDLKTCAKGTFYPFSFLSPSLSFLLGPFLIFDSSKHDYNLCMLLSKPFGDSC